MVAINDGNLEISQSTFVPLAIEMWKGFLKSEQSELLKQGFSFETVERGLLALGNVLANVLLKDVEAAVVPRLLEMPLLRNQHVRHREVLHFLLAKWERSFQQQRNTSTGLLLLNEVLSPFFVSHSQVRNVWIPGCGDSLEAPWIHKTFQRAEKWYMDICPEGLAYSTEILRSDTQARVCNVNLLEKSSLPTTDPEVILWFHPYVLDARLFGTVLDIAHEKSPESVKLQKIKGIRISSTAESIFNNLYERLVPGGTIFFSTLEEGEKWAILNSLQAKNPTEVQSFRNPFALKTLTTLLARPKPPRFVESRAYHHLIRCVK